MLAGGEITLDRSGAEPVLRYHDHVSRSAPAPRTLPLPSWWTPQHYRLAYWRVGDEELNYRRFFDVDTARRLRVEDPDVFAATHALLVALVARGQGRRAAHRPPRRPGRPARATCDGCRRPPSDAWVVVEKILEGDEALPADWQCAGTTGYDALPRRSTGCSSTQPGRRARPAA